MGTRGFSLTRVILVAVLLGALFTISKVVNPPPALPGDAKLADEHDDHGDAPPVGKNGMGTDAMKQQQIRDYKAKADAISKTAKANKSKPQTIKQKGMDITPKFFDESPMGEAGVKEMDKKWKEADEVEANQKRQVPKLAPSIPSPTAGDSGASSSSPPAAASGK